MGKTNNKSNNNNKNKNNMAEENKFADSFLDFSNIPGSMDELLASSQSTNAFTKGKIVAGNRLQGRGLRPRGRVSQIR